MPGGDGTGPAGRGPMSGRGAGNCAGNANFGAGRNGGRGSGAGGGRRGWRNQFQGRGSGRWPAAAGAWFKEAVAPPHSAGQVPGKQLDEKESGLDEG